jgi:hypothetical protein
MKAKYGIAKSGIIMALDAMIDDIKESALFLQPGKVVEVIAKLRDEMQGAPYTAFAEEAQRHAAIALRLTNQTNLENIKSYFVSCGDIPNAEKIELAKKWTIEFFEESIIKFNRLAEEIAMIAANPAATAEILGKETAESRQYYEYAVRYRKAEAGAKKDVAEEFKRKTAAMAEATVDKHLKKFNDLIASRKPTIDANFMERCQVTSKQLELFEPEQVDVYKIYFHYLSYSVINFFAAITKSASEEEKNRIFAKLTRLPHTNIADFLRPEAIKLLEAGIITLDDCISAPCFRDYRSTLPKAISMLAGISDFPNVAKQIFADIKDKINAQEVENAIFNHPIIIRFRALREAISKQDMEKINLLLPEIGEEINWGDQDYYTV